MSYLYCRHCGHKNIFTLNPPNFCNSCGTAFIEGASPQKSKVEREERPLEDDETDVHEVPDVGKLDVDISYGERKVWKGSDFLQIEESEVEQNKNKRAKKSKKSNVRRKVRRSR